eukprot:CAMPEP_0206171588 /NCGR_PEP_ID=MMETSP1474-20131121/42951_1 /ASSEMBLY_ACC=CAM_ASM_001110 /TAXON_ID=97495 /ORGANISM="Imantonia sp., Strain RCC918" /LENGTH=254 /DNA_ID=CAMNT_0053579185 /DNA_START=443 /DNA_END=1205 /DNA_ORIENTATION=+
MSSGDRATLQLVRHVAHIAVHVVALEVGPSVIDPELVPNEADVVANDERQAGALRFDDHRFGAQAALEAVAHTPPEDRALGHEQLRAPVARRPANRPSGAAALAKHLLGLLAQLEDAHLDAVAKLRVILYLTQAVQPLAEELLRPPVEVVRGEPIGHVVAASASECGARGRHDDGLDAAVNVLMPTPLSGREALRRVLRHLHVVVKVTPEAPRKVNEQLAAVEGPGGEMGAKVGDVGSGGAIRLVISDQPIARP